MPEVEVHTVSEPGQPSPAAQVPKPYLTVDEKDALLRPVFPDLRGTWDDAPAILCHASFLPSDCLRSGKGYDNILLEYPFSGGFVHEKNPGFFAFGSASPAARAGGKGRQLPGGFSGEIYGQGQAEPADLPFLGICRNRAKDR